MISYYKDENGSYYFEKDNVIYLKTTINGSLVVKEKCDGFIKIKKRHYNEGVNNYYNKLQMKWSHDGNRFRSSEPLFDDNKLNEFYGKLPRYKLTFYNESIIVLHQGRLYYCVLNPFDKCLLFDFKTKVFCKYTYGRNVKLVFNVTNNCYI